MGTAFLKIGAIWLLIQSLFTLVLGTIVTAVSTIVQIFGQVLTGRVGVALLGLSALWFGSYIVQETQVTVATGIDSGYCQTANARQDANAFAAVIFPQLSPFICLWDWGLSFTSFATQSFVTTAFPCVNYQVTFVALKEFVGTILQTVITFLFLDGGPTNNKFDFASIFDAWTNLIDTIRPVFECVCEGIIDLYDFIIEIVTNKNLGCFIDQTILTVTQFLQGWWHVFFNNLVLGVKFKPSLAFLDSTCTASTCLGDFLDSTLQSIFELFRVNAPNFHIGCIISRAFCLVIDVVYIFFNIYVEIVWDANFDAILGTNFDPILKHLGELAECIWFFFALFDTCLGQTLGSIVFLIRDFLAFGVQLLQDGIFEFELLSRAVKRLVGQATYGNGRHVGRSNAHAQKFTQTGLTCLVSRLFLVTGNCGNTYGDLVNSFLEFLLIPMELIQAVIDNQDLLASFEDENPVSGANRIAFAEFLNAILNVTVDRLFGILDYLAHTLACPPLLNVFGSALVGLVTTLRRTWSDVQDVIVILIELLFQSVILLFTMFGARIYGDFAQETVTWVQIFVQILLVILETLFQIFITLVDYILFPYFPRIFGQKSLLTYTTTNPDALPVATFTACIASFAPDCICGLTLALANELCLPAGLGCLGDLWPGCGLFQTTPTSDRRREYKYDSTTGTDKPIYHADELPYEDIFDYFATEFSDGFCGKVFASWRNTMKNNETIGELDSAVYIACLSMIRISANFGNGTDIKVATKENWVMDATTQTVQGLGVLFVNQAKSALSYGTSVSCMLGSSQCASEAEIYNFTDDVDAYGIDNPIARDIAFKTYDLFTELKVETVNVYESSITAETPSILTAGAELAVTASTALGRTLGISRLFAKELAKESVLENLATASTQLYTWTTSQDWTTRAEPELNLNVKRDLDVRHHNDGAGPQKEWLPNFENETGIELPQTNMTLKGVLFWHRLNQFTRAARGWAGLAFGTYMYAMVEQQRTLAAAKGVPLSMYKTFDIPDGSPYDTVAPFAKNFGHYYQGQRLERRSIWKDIHGANPTNSSYPYSPLEVGKVHTNLTFIYGTGGYIRFANHIPDSCTQVLEFCQGPNVNACVGGTLYENFGLCQEFYGGYSIVSECSSVPGNEFQAFAIYTSATCSNAPTIVVFANATSPTACKRLTISGIQYYFCVKYDGCRACPVDQVIPGFECAVLDQWFHRTEEFGKICLAEFLGVKTIDFSLNFTTPIATSPDVFQNTNPVQLFTNPTPTPTPGCSNVCGNGILEPCEQCDDNNRFSNDGCSYPSCKIEKCPKVFNLPADTSNVCSGPGSQILANPSSCITTIASLFLLESTQISCIPAKPMLYSYPGSSCTANSEVSRRQITQACGVQPSLCLEFRALPNGAIECVRLSGLGVNVTCGSNCYVCGNGILEKGEECDVNPYTSLGCSYCLTTCVPTPGQLGTGICRFGSLDGIPCVGGLGIVPVCNGDSKGTCLYDNCVAPARKRGDLDIQELLMLANYSEALAAERIGSLHSNDRRQQLPEQIYNEQAMMNYAVVQKPNSLTTWIEPVFNKIYNYITNGDGNITETLINRITNSVGNVDYGLNVPKDQRSILWYPVFAFWCRVPGNLVGQVGIGLWDGTIEFIKWTSLLIVISGIIYTQLPSFLIMLLMLFGPSIWLGLTFGFSYPGCTLFASPPLVRLPIHIFDEALDVLQRFNSTYIDWPEGFISGPINGTCTGREAANCQNLGFYDGIDEWYFLFQWWKPSINTWIYDSPIGGFLSRSIYFTAPRDNFNFVEPSAIQKLCFYWNILMLSQPIAILTAAAALSVGAAIVLYVFFNNLGILIFAIFELIGAFSLDGISDEMLEFVDERFATLYNERKNFKGFNFARKYEDHGYIHAKED